MTCAFAIRVLALDHHPALDLGKGTTTSTIEAEELVERKLALARETVGISVSIDCGLQSLALKPWTRRLMSINHLLAVPIHILRARHIVRLLLPFFFIGDGHFRLAASLLLVQTSRANGRTTSLHTLRASARPSSVGTVSAVFDAGPLERKRLI